MVRDGLRLCVERATQTSLNGRPAQLCLGSGGEMGLLCLTSSFIIRPRGVRGTDLPEGVLPLPLPFPFPLPRPFPDCRVWDTEKGVFFDAS